MLRESAVKVETARAVEAELAEQRQAEAAAEAERSRLHRGAHAPEEETDDEDVEGYLAYMEEVDRAEAEKNAGAPTRRHPLRPGAGVFKRPDASEEDTFESDEDDDDEDDAASS